jgi:hypothetical protein
MTSYAVRLEVPLTARAGDRTAAIVGRLDDRLAAWPGKSVRDAQLESQLGRGGRVGKVRATMTVQAADAARALEVALEVLRQAIGADARSWDVAGAAATVAPAGGAVPEPPRRPNLVWRKPLRPVRSPASTRPGSHRRKQVSARLPSRLISRTSAPEFGELPGKGSALLVTGSSGGRTRRQIHQIAAERIAGVAVREDGFDSAAAGA